MDKTTIARSDEKKIGGIKRILILSVIMVIGLVNAAVYYFHHSNMNNSYEMERKKTHDSQVSLLNYLINENAIDLSHHVEMMSDNTKKEGLLITDIQQKERNEIEKFWDRLSIDQDVNGMVTAGPPGNIIQEFGKTSIIIKSIENLSNSDNGSPNVDTHIFCHDGCFQIISIPVFIEAKISYFIHLSASLSSVFYEYSRITGQDIALLSDDGTINLMTNPISTTSILNKTAFSESLNKVNGDTGIQRSNGEYFNITFYPISQKKDYISFINNVTPVVNSMNYGLIQNVAVSISGMILASFLLGYILRPPVTRLRWIAEMIPKLAMDDVSQVKESMNHNISKSININEISLLENSVFELAERLIDLNKKVDIKVRELTRERDFNRKLLESAQVAIITQSSCGDIILSNDYAKNNLGVGEIGQGKDCLSYLFIDDGLSGKYTSKISNVFSGETKNLWHEAQVRCIDGAVRTIVWIHSHLDNTTSGVPGCLSVGLDVTERKQAESRLSWLADHDSLTGLYNRRKFHEDFSRIVTQAKRYNHEVSLLFFDLDKFKNINDTKGHAVGDQVIKAIANALKDEVRSCDVVARLGGDEFALVLPEIGIDGAIQVGNKIISKISSIRIPGVTEFHYFSSSVGISVFPIHSDNTDELLANADIAMYQAKAKGKGIVHVFSGEEQVRERIENEMYWENRITRALRKKHFVLHYQPILDISSNRINHYEVLLRMQSSRGVLFSPSGFISIAEKTSHIREIDHWVLESAIRRLDSFRIEGHDISFSINLSAHAFSDDTLLPHLEMVLSEINTPAHNIVFEITETAALEDFSAACDMMYKIRALGCRFALDDFGVGFSSFSYIRDLPVDYIKIDGTFIRELANSRDDQILVQALATIADGYGKKTIAEYVEDQDTLNLLREYHVDMAQGYHIGKPKAELIRNSDARIYDVVGTIQ